MDITVNSWGENVRYVKNDIVKLGEILTVADIDVSSSTPSYMTPLGSINARDDLMVRAFVKKENPSDSLDDPTQALIYSTAAAGGYSKVDQATSNAVGVGLSFFDAGAVHLGSIDLHESIKIVSSDEISSKEWFLMEKFVPASCMPPGTAQIKIVLFACGYLRGTFKFKEINASNAYPYFYCTTKHLSTSSNSPITTSTNWTQKFNWRASYGSSVGFKGDNYSIQKEEGESFDVSKSLNALPMRMSVSFNERDDREAKAIIHFLQEKYFQYEGIYNLNYLGERNELAEVGAFDFTFTKPYKTSQKVVCREFSQDLDFRNNNNITASFENLYASQTSTVSSFDGYNYRLDFLSYLKLPAGAPPYSKAFVKDVPVTLDIYTSTDANGGVVPPAGAENCQSFGVFFPPGINEIAPTDPATGGDRIFLFQNYRKVKLTSTITKSSTTISVTPLESFSVSSSLDHFPILIPCVGGQSSMYIEEPEEILWYPWLRLRSFPFKASSSQDVPQAPRHVNASFTSYYKKLYKAGPNQNLLQLSVSFDYRTEREAKEILLFLEQHLGYKRFRFQLPRPYTKGDTAAATLAEKRISMFFCPEWKHSVVFKNCHRIEAKFIETPSGITQEPFDIYALPADSFSPCIASAYYPDLVKYEICPRTSSAVAQHGCEFSGSNLIAVIKSSDIMIAIDRSGSMDGKRMDIANKVARQIIGAHKQCPLGDGRCEDQDFTYASEFSDISPPEIVPPYNGASLTNSEIAGLRGYQMEWMDRFAIKIDEKRVNIGIVYFSTGASTSISLDGSTAAGTKPNSYDKKKLMNTLTLDATGGTSYVAPMQAVTDSFHGSDRNYLLDNRILIFISDGLPHDADPMEGARRAEALRGGGELAQRLRASSRGAYAEKVRNWIAAEKAAGKTDEEAIAAVYERGYDASFTDTALTPAWVEEDQPTATFAVGIGLKEDALVEMGSEFGGKRLFFESNQTGELIKLVNIIINMTEDSGSQNYFSVTVSNCGPKPIKIKNTIVRFDSDDAGPLWTAKRTPGVNVRTVLPPGSKEKPTEVLLDDVIADRLSPEENTGGQYQEDPNAPNTPDPEQLINWEWRNGNVVAPGGDILQLWRNCKRYDVDNPDGDTNIAANWSASQGADNIGIFAKDKFVRSFVPKDDGLNKPTLEIQDLNIGNVHLSNPWGDYSHLPELQPGESLDLFFVAISNRLFGTMEQIQFVFDTEEVGGKMGCYANLDFNLWTQIQKAKEEEARARFETVEEPTPLVPDPVDPVIPGIPVIPQPVIPQVPPVGDVEGPIYSLQPDGCGPVVSNKVDNAGNNYYRSIIQIMEGRRYAGSAQMGRVNSALGGGWANLVNRWLVGELTSWDIRDGAQVGGFPLGVALDQAFWPTVTWGFSAGTKEVAKWTKQHAQPVDVTRTAYAFTPGGYRLYKSSTDNIAPNPYAREPRYPCYDGGYALEDRNLIPCSYQRHDAPNYVTWELNGKRMPERFPAFYTSSQRTDDGARVFWGGPGERGANLECGEEWTALRLRLLAELNGEVPITVMPDWYAIAGGMHTIYDNDGNYPPIMSSQPDFAGNIGGISVQHTDNWRNW